ncbi:MAG: type secretion target repeat protein, partial [Solirubrobacterales bacterium]|nr:type secretion target repeat protein [Solirubrobacterales bacterium]
VFGICITRKYWIHLIQTDSYDEFNTHTINAHYPIKVTFLGTAAGEVDVASNSNILVDGSILNPSGSTKIATTAGSISMLNTDGMISGRNVDLSATSGIGSSTSALPVRITANEAKYTTSAGSRELNTPVSRYRTETELASAPRVLAWGDTVRVGDSYAHAGTHGRVYSYIGTQGVTVDLTTTDYANRTNWAEVTADVRDVIADGDALYQYLGAAALVDLSDAVQHYATSPSTWAVIPVRPSLKAITTAGGVFIDNASDSLPIDQVTSADGANVVLTSNGDIVVAHDGPSGWHSGLVSGGQITLLAGGKVAQADFTSPNLGVVGGLDRPIVLDSGLAPNSTMDTSKVNIRAKGDVYVSELNGDLWLEELRATNGNAWVQVQNGRLLDANTIALRDERTYAELAGGVWKSLQLIGPASDLKLQAQKDTFAHGREREYRQYWVYRNQQVDPVTLLPVSSATFCNTCNISLTAQEVAWYRNFYTENAAPGIDPLVLEQNIQDSLATLRLSRTIQYRTLNAQWEAYFVRINGVPSMPTSYVEDNPNTPADEGFHYVLSTDETNRINGGIKKWTADELLNLMGVGLLKETTDTEVSIEHANILADDVTIISSGDAVAGKGTIGRTVGQTQIALDNHTLDPDENVALGAAERTDVTYIGGTLMTATVTYNHAARTITRSSGTWSGFGVGDVIRVDGTTNSSLIGVAYYTVAAVTATTITVAGGPSAPPITDQTNVRVNVVPIIDPTVTTTITFDAAARTITKSTDWTGITAESTIKVAGNTPNANTAFTYYTVESVSGHTITLKPGAVLVSQVNVPNITVRPVALNPTFEAVQTYTGVNVTVADHGFNDFGRVGDTVTRSGGSWLDDGFAVGDLVRIGGAGPNHSSAFSSLKVVAVTADTLTFSDRDRLSNQPTAAALEFIRGRRPATTAIIIDQRDDVDLTAGGKIDVTATGNVLLGSETTMNIGTVQTHGTASLKSGQSILSYNDATAPGTTCEIPPSPSNVHFCTGNLILEAATGTIGSKNHPIFTDGYLTGTLTARAAGDIYIFNRTAPAVPGTDGAAGDMNLETAYSASGMLHLEADGSILDALNTDFVKLKAGHIELNAGGAIGALGNALEVDTGADTGDLTALGGGSIWLTETEGDLNVRLVKSKAGDVTLVAAAILDGPDVASQDVPGIFGANAVTGSSRPGVDVVGRNINLTALAGTIGEFGNELDIDTDHREVGDTAVRPAGTLTSISMAANTYIIEPLGDLAINTVSTTDNKIAFITALAGAILNGTPDNNGDGQGDGDNVISGKVWLFARDNIGTHLDAGAGTVNNWLTTAAGLIQGRSLNSSVQIRNTGPIEIGCVSDFPATGCDDPNGIQAATAVYFDAYTAPPTPANPNPTSPIVLTKDVSAGGLVVITSGNPTGPGSGNDTVTVTADKQIVSGSTINVNARNIIVLVPGSVTQAADAIVLDAVDAGASITATAATLVSGSTITGTAAGDVLLQAGTTVTAAGDVLFKATNGNALIGFNATATSIFAGIPFVPAAHLMLFAGPPPIGNVTIESGNDIRIWETASIYAPDLITITGDGVGASDAAGTTILVEGSLESTLIRVLGHQDPDTIVYTPVSLIGHTEIEGAGASDDILVDQLPTVDEGRKFLTGDGTPQDLVTANEAIRARDFVDVDGQGAQDHVVVNLTGQTGTDYIVKVHDTGDPGNGADVLTINGTDAADVYLIRANYDAPGSPAFVARMQPSHPDATVFDPTFEATYERVDYDRTINVVRVNGGQGKDRFYSDDTSAIMTLDGGADDDYFQFGQLFGAPRTSDAISWMADQDGNHVDELLTSLGTVAPTDELKTTQTTRGFLTRGISFPAVVYGGGGNDNFVVYSNKALLKLFGETGNDEFLVRAFALKDGSVAGADTVINGGQGDDRVEYNINAPVSIDGGEGVDTVVVVGTEFGDNFVITSDGVMGAGLAIEYSAVERVDIDGMEGDDHFFVLSTNPNVITTIIGGEGSDTVDVGGDVTETIVALSVEGVSGTINHSVTSNDPAYNGVFAPGVRLNVAGAGTGTVIATQSGGDTTVTEGSLTASNDSYTLQFAARPSTATVAYITVSAALSSSADVGGQSVQVSIDGNHWFDALVLTFDTSDTGGPNDWDRVQTIFVHAVDDSAEEGDRIVVVSHSIQSSNAAFDRLNISNVEVHVIDDDKAGLIVQPSGIDTLVVEGGASDTYTVALAHTPNAGETVTAHLLGDWTQIDVAAVLDPTGRYDAVNHTVTFDSGNWSTPFELSITAVDDSVRENRMFRTIFHQVTSTGGAYSTGQAVPQVSVDVRDNDTGGVVVIQSDGSTLVSDGVPDTYELRLTRAPSCPASIDPSLCKVTVSIVTDGKTLVSANDAGDTRFVAGSGATYPAVVFGTTDWDTPFVVRVDADPNAPTESTEQPEQHFPAQPHVVADLAGPLVVEGGKIIDRPVINGVKLPSETDIDLPIVFVPVDESTQTDTLNVFNDGSVSDDTGSMGTITAAEAYALAPLYHLASGSVNPAPFRQITGLGTGGPLTLDYGTLAAPDVRTYAPGVTFHEFEVVNVLLGQGNDTFTINDTAPGAITVVQGGGNTALAGGQMGGDHITVNGGGGAGSPLVVFGDTSQDGSLYDSTTIAITGRGREFPNAGNDVIDAHASNGSVAIYGGEGDDVIIGSQGDDHLAGGSGNDTINGQRGADHVYGDDGFNVDLSKRLSLSTQILALVNGPSSGDHLATSDALDAGSDKLYGDDGADVIFGDHGRVEQVAGTNRLLTTGAVVGVLSVRINDGATDVITGDAGDDLLIGGGAGDIMDGNTGDDLIFGDEVALVARDADITDPRFRTLIGDMLYTRTDRPDAAPATSGLPASGLLADLLYNRPDWVGDANANTSGRLLIDQAARAYRDSDLEAPDWAHLQIVELWHTALIESGYDEMARPASFGGDYIAGGAGDDVIFGQLGNDVIQGDGSIASALAGDPVGAARGRSEDGGVTDLGLTPSFEVVATDGDDYVEGGGGNDVIFGNLGQDDLIGGSSNLFTLDTPDKRPDGNDIIFGGAGTRIDRNDYSDDLASRHAQDADTIVGDNGNIHRIVGIDHLDGIGTDVAYASFNYDLYGTAADGYGPERIVVRGVDLLDYTPGGPSYRPDLFKEGMNLARCGRDIGGRDEVHGESGDDTIYGGCAGDALYGDGQDDDLIGGWGDDFLSGGTGQDGILGDDGRIFTSRNSDQYGEPLYGELQLTAADLDENIQAQFGAQQATINVSGALKKTVDETPFNLQPNQQGAGDPLYDATYADDIIFGGLGSDFLHGGAGDDAISGAEALDQSYAQRYDAKGTLVGTVRVDYTHPFNPGDALHYGADLDSWQVGIGLDTGLVNPTLALLDSSKPDEHGEFALYDEYDPRRAIQLGTDGKATKDGSGGQFFLNFRADDPGAPTVSNEYWGTVQTDGNDAIFGDLGNDWLVGGTGQDTLWGGFGDDLLNADDDLGTNGGLNDRPDTHPSYEDRAVGGAGRDILIANTGGDRLIDWQGLADTFIVPFWWDSMPTISRWLVPKADELLNHYTGTTPLWDSTGCWFPRPANAVDELLALVPVWQDTDGCRWMDLEPFLYKLAASQGADPTRATDVGADPARNGEPYGELGLVTPYDGQYWNDQIGLPSDPPGFIPFQRRDVWFSSAIEDGTTLPFTHAEDQLFTTLFGSPNLGDLLFPYDGTHLAIGTIQLDIGGAGHAIALTDPGALGLVIDANGVVATLAGQVLDLDLGLPTPDDHIGTPILSPIVTIGDVTQTVLNADDGLGGVVSGLISGLVTGIPPNGASDAQNAAISGTVGILTDALVSLDAPLLDPVTTVLQTTPIPAIPMPGEDFTALDSNLGAALSPVLTATTTTVTSTLDTAAATTTAAVAPLLTTTTTTATGSLAPLAATLESTATSTTNTLAAAVAPTVTSVTTTTAAVTATIAPTATAVTAPVSAAVTTVAASVAPTVTSVASSVTAAIVPVTAATTTALAPVTSLLTNGLVIPKLF